MGDNEILLGSGNGVAVHEKLNDEVIFVNRFSTVSSIFSKFYKLSRFWAELHTT